MYHKIQKIEEKKTRKKLSIFKERISSHCNKSSLELHSRRERRNFWAQNCMDQDITLEVIITDSD